MQTASPQNSSATRRSSPATRCCGPACIAGSAPRRARPSCCSGTSSIRRAGRIYLIKDMLESGRPATEEVVRHVDRCLSCLACMSTCPSGVNYMHLVDHARTYIEETYRRPRDQRLLRDLLARVLPRPRLLRAALRGGAAGQGVAGGCCRGGRGWAASSTRCSTLAPARAAAAEPDAAAAGASGAGRAPRPGRAADRLRADRARSGDQRGHHPAADPDGDRGGDRARASAAAARSPITWASTSRRWRAPAPRSPAGCARSRARGSTRSSSTPPAAARR